jgi:hypothetical protein
MKSSSAIIGSILALAFSLYLGRIAWTALRSGIAEVAGGKQYRRRKEPLRYWATTATQSLFCLALLIVAVFSLTSINE